MDGRGERERLARLTVCASALTLAVICFTLIAPALLKDKQTRVDADAASATVVEDPLIAFQRDRRDARDLEIEQLNRLIADEAASDALREDARGRLAALVEWIEQETTIEGVLRARGYADCVATVHSGSVNVLIRSENVSRADSAIIFDLVARETGATGGDVRVIPLGD